MKSNAKTPAELRHKKPEKEVEPRKAKERGKTLLERGLNQAFGTPTAKQWQFLEATTRYVGFGGSRGGGKSHVVRTKATILSYRYPGIKILIIRESFPMLRRNYINPLRAAYAVLPDEDAPRWSDTDKAFIFPNGSTIELGYCATDADIAGYVGNEWDVLFLDEATQLSEEQFYGLNSCVRGVNKYPKRTYITCNPGGQGHEWVKRLFIDKEYRKGEIPRDYTFLQSRVYDNIPLLMADKGFTDEWTRYRQRTGKRVLNEEAILACIDSSTYVQALKQGAPEMVKAWLEGDWNVYSGKFFGEFDPRVHVIPDMTEDQIPSYWRRTAAVDYGLDCFAVLWFAESPTGDVICYRNYEQSNLIVERAAATFLEMSKYDKLEYVSAPPDLWNRRNDSGRSAADIFADYGVHFTMAGNNREQGWLSVKEYLAYDPVNPHSKPRLRFLDTCKHVIKNIQLLQFDVKKPNDVDGDLNHDWTHSCLVGDTIVNTVDGDINISELVGKTGEVYCWDGKGKTVRRFSDVRMTQKDAPIVSILTDDGREIKCTYDHKILTTTGWKAAGMLADGDDIVDVNL